MEPRSDEPRRRWLSFVEAIESASKSPYVPPSLRGALRTLASIRRRSGNDPREACLTSEERELRRVLAFVLRGDSEACAYASALTRKMLTNLR